MPFYAAHVSLVTVLDLRKDRATDRYLITSQDDRYQTDQFVRFVLPWIGGPLVTVLQLVATAVTAVLALVFSGPMAWADQRFKISEWQARGRPAAVMVNGTRDGQGTGGGVKSR